MSKSMETFFPCKNEYFSKYFHAFRFQFIRVLMDSRSDRWEMFVGKIQVNKSINWNWNRLMNFNVHSANQLVRKLLWKLVKFYYFT